MYLVTVYEAYISEKEYKFSSLPEANDFLYEEGFTYDSFDDEAHLWVFGEYTYGIVELIQQHNK